MTISHHMVSRGFQNSSEDFSNRKFQNSDTLLPRHRWSATSHVCFGSSPLLAWRGIEENNFETNSHIYGWLSRKEKNSNTHIYQLVTHTAHGKVARAYGSRRVYVNFISKKRRLYGERVWSRVATGSSESHLLGMQGNKKEHAVKAWRRCQAIPIFPGKPPLVQSDSLP